MPPFKLTVTGDYVRSHLSGENRRADLKKYII